MPRKVLIVEDDKNIADLMRLYLEKESMDCQVANDGLVGLEKFQQFQPDLVMLDIMLPGMDGWSICRKIRETSKVPIIMLTAKGEDADKIMGFECGADDYITKPFNILEVKARIRALLRRAGTSTQQKKHTNCLVHGAITLDLDQRVARRDGHPVELTAKEFDLMELLMRNPGRVYSRENLLNVVWGYEYVGEFRTVDVHIRRLREKCEIFPDFTLVTVRGLGYKAEKVA